MKATFSRFQGFLIHSSDNCTNYDAIVYSIYVVVEEKNKDVNPKFNECPYFHLLQIRRYFGPRGKFLSRSKKKLSQKVESFYAALYILVMCRLTKLDYLEWYKQIRLSVSNNPTHHNKKFPFYGVCDISKLTCEDRHNFNFNFTCPLWNNGDCHAP